MSTLDEVFDTMAVDDTTVNVDEVLVIDPNTRQITIPGSELIFGVESDTHSERKYFSCPRIVGNNVDLSSCFIRVNYRNANGEVDAYLVDDVAIVNDNVTFSWELSRKVTLYKGQVKFVVCACRPGSEAVEWNTTLTNGIVLEGLEPDVDGIASETSDAVAQLLGVVSAQTVAVETVGEEQISAVKAEGAVQVVAVKEAAETAEAVSVAEIEAKGTNTLASIPADYTALSEAVDTLARTTAPGIVCEAEGETIVISDASNQAVQNLRIFGKSTQDGVPSPDAPVEIVSVENPTVTMTDGTEDNVQTLNIPRILPGIPVTSGGNYTDSNGQQWICDEVDLARGVYVQRVHTLVFNGEEEIDNTWYPVAIYHLHSPKPHVNLIHSSVRSSHFRNVSCGNTLGTSVAIGNLDKLGFASSDDLTAYFAEQYEKNNPVTFQYVIETPIETPLSETEIAAYRALHTNKPNTTILNDSGAWMDVEYVADTKLYIDNKIVALVKGE